jgi:hypothetical protein
LVGANIQMYQPYLIDRGAATVSVRDVSTIPTRWSPTTGDRLFVVAIAQAFVRGLSPSEAAEFLGAAAAQISSWAAIEDLLEMHGCLPIAYHCLRVSEVRAACGLPDATMARLRDAYTGAFVWVARYPATLRRLLGALSQADVPALVLKGPVLGPWLYHDSALRSSADIDLLLPETHAHHAHAVLSELGYEIDSRQTPGPRLCPPRESLHSVTYHDEGGEVDIVFDALRAFWQPAPAEGRVFDAWWDRRLNLSIGNLTVPTLGPEDQLLYLCRHLQGHDYGRTKWFVDILLLLRRYADEFDWELVGCEARRHNVQGGVYRTLELIEHTYGASIPTVARRALRPRRIVRSIHRRMWPDDRAIPGDANVRLLELVTPHNFRPKGARDAAGFALFLFNRNRRLHLTYLLRRMIPPRSWLLELYSDRLPTDAPYPVLWHHHWRSLRPRR